MNYAYLGPSSVFRLPHGIPSIPSPCSRMPFSLESIRQVRVISANESGTCTTGNQLESSRDESARQGGVCMHGHPSRRRSVPRGAIVEGEERWEG